MSESESTEIPTIGDAIHQICERLWSQDNRATAHPIYVVEQRRRLYGFDPAAAENLSGRGGGITYLGDDSEEVPADLAESLEAGWRANGRVPRGYSRIGYVDTWVYVTACLTEAGAEAYIRLDGHNLREPRIFVASGQRNAEWMALRAFFSEAAISRARG